MTVSCGRKGCGKSWPRDPALEIECPDCHAAPGVQCKRPSGHRVWGGEPHGARDILAYRRGLYGAPCPLGICGQALDARAAKAAAP